MDTSPLGDPVGFLSGPDLIELPADPALVAAASAAAESIGVRFERGVIASGDQFIASGEKKKWIRETFGAISCEMEGAAIAHACS
jgi:adenosylhomocysteine nucleosidase